MGLHQYKIHSDKPFQCKLCGEKGNGASQYSNHMRKHKEPKSIQCEICQYESTDASNMKKNNTKNTILLKNWRKSQSQLKTLGGLNIEQMLRGDGYHPLNDQIMRSIWGYPWSYFVLNCSIWGYPWSYFVLNCSIWGYLGSIWGYIGTKNYSKTSKF